MYDLIILGGGPGGLSAGICAGRAMLDTLIIEKERVGGHATIASAIYNYPGVRKTTGVDLMDEMYEQTKEFAVEWKKAEVLSVDLAGDVKTVETTKGIFTARSIVIATGADKRKVGFVGEDDFVGKGIAYCATCDGDFFRDMNIFVLGGGEKEATEALYLTKFGKKVTMVTAENGLTCSNFTKEEVQKHPKIHVMYESEVIKVAGDEFLQLATFRNKKTGEITTYEEVDGFGMFVF